MRKYLTEIRLLSIDICVRYCVGYSLLKFRHEVEHALKDTSNSSEKWRDELCLTFPWRLRENVLPLLYEYLGDTKDGDKGFGDDEMRNADEKNKLVTVRLKHRSIETKGRQRLAPRGGSPCFYRAKLYSQRLVHISCLSVLFLKFIFIACPFFIVMHSLHKTERYYSDTA